MIRPLAFLLAATAVSAQSHWPAQLEADVNTRSWEAAVRVGAAIVEEIDAGRLLARVADVAEEIRIRDLYATALDRTGDAKEAQHQRALARNLKSDPGERRLANLRAELLASETRRPAPFPRSPHVQIVSFWADWCPLCKPELAQLAKYHHPNTSVLTLNVDHLDPSLRPYVLPQSLQSSDLPQLYVIDPAGNIRFHLTGYEDDGLFTRKLDWMIEAVLHESAK